MTGQEARDDEREALLRRLNDDHGHRLMPGNNECRTCLRRMRMIFEWMDAAGYRKHPEPENSMSASQRVTMVLGTDDWVIVRNGDGLVTDAELDDFEARKHPAPEITDEQVRAVMTVDAIAHSTGMSRADVIATVRAIGEPLHGWEYGHEVSLHTGTTIHPVADEKTARTLAWLHPAYKRHAPGPWVPVGEGEQ